MRDKTNYERQNKLQEAKGTTKDKQTMRHKTKYERQTNYETQNEI